MTTAWASLRRSPNRRLAPLYAALLLAPSAGLATPHPAVSKDAIEGRGDVQAVWALESEYWSAIAAVSQDQPRFQKLFSDDFVGWPCSAPRPMMKADLKGDPVKMASPASIERLGAIQNGDVVVVYYRASVSLAGSHAAAQLLNIEITHSWIRSKTAGWEILGGMCRPGDGKG